MARGKLSPPSPCNPPVHSLRYAVTLPVVLFPIHGPAVEKKRILLVDDEPALTTLYSLILEGTGRLLVRTENCGARAVSTALNFAPHAILIDFHFPDRHGFQIAEAIREERALECVPIAFLTGSINKEQAATYRERFGFLVLTKPILIPELIASVLQLTA